MKKFLSLALSVLMLLSLLAGCGGGSSTDDGAQQDGGSETAETGGKLVVYSALNEDNTIAMAEQFEKDTGIEVEYISLGGGNEQPTGGFPGGRLRGPVRLPGGGRGAAGIRLPQQR